MRKELKKILRHARGGKKELRNFLVENEIEIDTLDDETNRTALMEAIIADEDDTLDIVTAIVKCEADVNHQDNDGWTALMYACKLGLEEVVEILAKNDARFDLYNKESDYAIHVACRSGFMSCISAMSEIEGFEVNEATANSSYNSSLAIAIVGGNAEMVTFLIDDLEASTDTILDEEALGWNEITYLMLAIQCNQQEIALELASRMENLSEQNRTDGRDALMMAAQMGWLDVVETLEEYGCERSSIDLKRKSALYHALENGHEDVAKCLIKSRRDFDGEESGGGELSPFLLACEKGYADLAELMLKKGADVNGVRDATLESALHLVCKNDHQNVFYLLMDVKRINLGLRSRNGRTALMEACIGGYYCCAADLSKKLEERKEFDVVSSVDDDGNTACLLAAKFAPLKFVHDFYHFYVDEEITIENKFGESVLHWIAQRGFKEVLMKILVPTVRPEKKELIMTGPIVYKKFYPDDVNKATKSGDTPLLLASRRGHVDCVAYLLKCGADVNIVGKNGVSALFELLSCEQLDSSPENVEVMILMADKSENVDRSYEEGWNALLMACKLGLSPLVSKLLSLGANINHALQSGATALNIACLHNHEETAKLLVNAGAEVNKCLEHSCSPLMVACSNGNKSLVEYLIQHGANVGFRTSSDGAPIVVPTHFETAFGAAVANKRLDIVYFLALSDVPFLEDGSPRANYGQTWTDLIDPSTGVPIQDVISIVRKVIERDISRVSALANVQDKNGRSALSIAHKSVQDVFKEYLFFCGRYELNEGPPLYKSNTSIVLRATDHGFLQDIEALFRKVTKSEELSQSEFKLCIDTMQSLVGDRERSDAEKEALFTSCAQLNGKTVTLSEFSKFCANTYGATRRVVIKFMMNEDQFIREKSIRENYNFKPVYVVGCLKEFSGPQFESAVASLQHVGAKYKFGLVFLAADRDLDAILSSEQPDINKVRGMMKDLALALEHLHSNEVMVMHGDVKPLNALRFGDKISLIDLDAAAAFDAEKSNKSFAGAKFTSSFLPPEMFVKLNDQEEAMYKEYWKERAKDEALLWSKIEPKKVLFGRNKGSFVVRTFDTVAETMRVRDPDLLPYKLVPASPAIDVWAFGVTVYMAVATEKSFFQQDKNGDISKAEDMSQVIGWGLDSTSLNALLVKTVKDATARALLQSIFLVPAEERPSMTQILQHDFFSGEANSAMLKLVQSIDAKVTEINDRTRVILERTHEIADMTDKVFLQIRKSEKILLKAMFEATEVRVPTCFIIVNQMLKDDIDGRARKPKDNESPPEEYSLEKAESWLSKMSALGAQIGGCVETAVGIAHGSQSAIVSAVQNLIPDTKSKNKLYLYLVDEFDMQPVFDPKGVFPIEINSPAEFIPKILPLMKVGLKAAAVVNGVANIGKCLGYPIPTIPKELLDQANASVGKLSQESSVAEYDVLQTNVSEMLKSVKGLNTVASKQQNVRGAALRELERFFAEEVKSNDFAGLYRVVTSEGLSCWTLPGNIEKMKQLEEDAVPHDSNDKIVTVVSPAEMADAATSTVDVAVPTEVVERNEVDSSRVAALESEIERLRNELQEKSETCHSPMTDATASSKSNGVLSDVQLAAYENDAKLVIKLGKELDRQRSINDKQVEQISSLTDSLRIVTQAIEKGDSNAKKGWFGGK